MALRVVATHIEGGDGDQTTRPVDDRIPLGTLDSSGRDERRGGARAGGGAACGLPSPCQ